MKKLRLCLLFYRSFGIFSLLISMICAYFFFLYGVSVGIFLFVFKIITLVVSVLYVNEYKRNDWYYYKNLGLNKKRLWTAAFVFDLLIYFALMSIALTLHTCVL